jgi:hypothetical protein
LFTSVKPDFHELKTDSPFFWQQSEYVMSGAATYLFSVLAADRLAKADKKQATGYRQAE